MFANKRDSILNDLKLVLPVSRIDCRKYFFAVRIVHIWNSLSNEIVLSSNSCIFKKKVKHVKLNSYLSGKI